MELIRIFRKMTPKEVIRKCIAYCRDDAYRFRVHKALGIYDRMPDDEYLCRLFQATTGGQLNLENPETFSEKLQWLKLHNRCPEYITMIDKLAAKAYVAQRIDEKHIIPTLGIWNHFRKSTFINCQNSSS